jgi:hypothetical protein
MLGFTFAPGGKESVKAYRIYQTLAIVMGLSRFFLALQYAVVAAFVCRKYKKLILPFILIIAILLSSGTALVVVSYVLLETMLFTDCQSQIAGSTKLQKQESIMSGGSYYLSNRYLSSLFPHSGECSASKSHIWLKDYPY